MNLKKKHRTQRTGDATGYLNSLVKRQPNFLQLDINYGKSEPLNILILKLGSALMNVFCLYDDLIVIGLHCHQV